MSAPTIPIVIELARRADAGPIAVRSRDWIERGLAWRWRRGPVEMLVREPDTEVVVARRQGQLVGFAAMRFRFPDRRAHLILLGVDPRLRRQGVGREIHAWLLEIARQAGTERIELEVRARNISAVAFYRAQGYRELVRVPGYYQGREDGLRMIWRRPPRPRLGPTEGPTEG